MLRSMVFSGVLAVMCGLAVGWTAAADEKTAEKSVSPAAKPAANASEMPPLKADTPEVKRAPAVTPKPLSEQVKRGMKWLVEHQLKKGAWGQGEESAHMGGGSTDEGRAQRGRHLHGRPGVDPRRQHARPGRVCQERAACRQVRLRRDRGVGQGFARRHAHPRHPRADQAGAVYRHLHGRRAAAGGQGPDARRSGQEAGCRRPGQAAGQDPEEPAARRHLGRPRLGHHDPAEHGRQGAQPRGPVWRHGR